MTRQHQLTVILLIHLLSAALFAALPPEWETALEKAATSEYLEFSPNRISCWVKNDSRPVVISPAGNSGLEWPAGSGQHAIFASGIYLVGLVDGQPRSAAADFQSEWLPGPMIYDPQAGTAGIPDDFNDPLNQIYSIAPGDCGDPLMDCYSREYHDWPADLGAPVDASAYPELRGSGMHWYVVNDENPLGHRNHSFNSNPLGIELQVTTWGYADGSPLENVLFSRYLLVNKGGREISDLYFSNWSDADIGDANDDLAGCDTSLDMGYFYNGPPWDWEYGPQPPAVGYLILKGPHIASIGDSAWYEGDWHPDQRNLGMTSFQIIQNSSNVFDDPENAEEAYNYMQGLTKEGDPWYEYLDPQAPETVFLYPGDPVTRSGWTEYDDQDPRDHKFFQNTGPFDLPPWRDPNGNGVPDLDEPGVQEIVVAIAVVQGGDHLDAITNLRHTARYVRTAWLQNMEQPVLPAPVLRSSAQDQGLVLSWYGQADLLESWQSNGYEFEGYELFQGWSQDGPWELIHTFDRDNGIRYPDTTYLDLETGIRRIEVNHQGQDYGLDRHAYIDWDVLRDTLLTNHRAYNFGLRAYAVSEDAQPRSVVSPITKVTLRPHGDIMGLEFTHEHGDTLGMNHTGNSDARIIAEVLDPGQLTGSEYQVGFQKEDGAEEGYWYLGRFENGLVVDTLHYQRYQSPGWNNPDQVTPFIEGFIVQVHDLAWELPRFNHSWEQTVNVEEGWLDSVSYLAIHPGGVDSLVWSDIVGSDTIHIDSLVGRNRFWDYPIWRADGDLTYITLYRRVYHDVWIQSFASDIGGSRHTASSIPGVGGGINDPLLLQSDLELRFTEEGSKAVRWKLRTEVATELSWVPFELWDLERNVQLCLGYVDWDEDGTLHDDSTGMNRIGHDWVVSLHVDYEAYQDSLLEFINGEYTGWLWIFNSSSVYSIGDRVELCFLNPTVAGEDFYTFQGSLPNRVESRDELIESLNRIQVFPNPYFGANAEEGPGETFVTFTGLPAGDCALRIFSLSGDLVRKLDHLNSSAAGTPYEYWDLRNELGEKVASGMYIVHVDVPGVGSKVLKLAIMQPLY